MAGQVFSMEERDREARFSAYSGVITKASFFMDSQSQHLRVLPDLSRLLKWMNMLKWMNNNCKMVEKFEHIFAKMT